MILGGTIFDLLGPSAGRKPASGWRCELLPGGTSATIEAAFEARVSEVEDAWRGHLRSIARPGPGLVPTGGSPAPGVPSSTSRASAAADSATKICRGPTGMNSGTSKPGPRLTRLGMPCSWSRPWIISASI